MEGIQKFCSSQTIKISSLHNFCPLPVEISRAAPDCYQFSSHRDLERQRAVRLTLQTIDFAKRLGADRVVLHMGSVPMDSFTQKLIKLANEGKINTDKYVATKLKAVKIREKKSPMYIERVKECLKRIHEFAAEREIRLGMEGRFAYEEIPSETEFPTLLREFDSPWVGYWHDFGHIQVKENLGFVDHAAWLRQVSHRFIGGHLHDTIWPDRDHQPPFTGDIDYGKLVPLLPPDKLFVWEMSPRKKADEIAGSLQKWRERFGSQ
jgi:sugar phosphate isomerase/epimerase